MPESGGYFTVLVCVCVSLLAKRAAAAAAARSLAMDQSGADTQVVGGRGRDPLDLFRGRHNSAFREWMEGKIIITRQSSSGYYYDIQCV